MTAMAVGMELWRKSLVTVTSRTRLGSAARAAKPRASVATATRIATARGVEAANDRFMLCSECDGNDRCKTDGARRAFIPNTREGGGGRGCSGGGVGKRG